MVASPRKSAPKSGKKANKSKKDRKQAQTAHQRAGLIFPVSRFQRLMKLDRLSTRVSRSSAVSMAAICEYVTSELVEMSGNLAQEQGKKRINNRHLLLSLRSDDELSKLFSDTIICEGGVVPHIESALVPAKKGKKGGEVGPSQEV